MRVWAYLFVLGVLFIFIVSLLIKVINTEHGYTELNLYNHRGLPNNVALGKTYTFSYVIKNRYKEDRTYYVDIFIGSPAKRVLINQRTVTVRPNEEIIVQDSFELNQPYGEVIVAIPEENLEVNFKVNARNIIVG